MPRQFRHGFTLIELLVVISIIALLIGILLPALGAASFHARTVNCLANMRNLEVAHWMYMSDHEGSLIDVGLGHGGFHASEEVAWINTLSAYYGNKLLARSPVDDSPHWAVEDGGAGVPLTPGGDQFRRTSYGVNNFLSSVAPQSGGDDIAYRRLDQVPRPSATVHFLIMAYTGSFAGADHPHVENWAIPGFSSATPSLAADHVQTDAHGGPPEHWESKAPWGFLDGSAKTLEFREVYRNFTQNNLDPRFAH